MSCLTQCCCTSVISDPVLLFYCSVCSVLEYLSVMSDPVLLYKCNFWSSASVLLLCLLCAGVLECHVWPSAAVQVSACASVPDCHVWLCCCTAIMSALCCSSCSHVRLCSTVLLPCLTLCCSILVPYFILCCSTRAMPDPVLQYWCHVWPSAVVQVCPRDGILAVSCSLTGPCLLSYYIQTSLQGMWPVLWRDPT